MRKFLFITLLLLFCQTAVATLATASAKDICSAEQLTKAREDFLDRFQKEQYGFANIILEKRFEECFTLSKGYLYKGSRQNPTNQRINNTHYWFLHDLMLSRIYAEKYVDCLNIGDLFLDRNAGQLPTIIYNSMKSMLAKCRTQTTRNCSDTALKNGMFWGVDSEALYTYTQGIVSAATNKDLPAFRKHIDEELSNGPRNRYMDGKEFSEIFSNEARAQIIESGPTCYVHSWRGIAIGGGIWIGYYSPNEFAVGKVWSATPENFYREDIPAGWRVDGTLITPDKFSKPDLAVENYRELATKLSQKSENAITWQPGKVLALTQEKLPAHEARDAAISLMHTATPTPDFTLTSSDNKTLSFERETGYFTQRINYKLLAEIPATFCQTLAPGFTGTCIQSYLIKVGEDTGGSMGTVYDEAIYGLFLMPDQTKIIAPLIKFTGDSDARNYLEDQNIAPTQLRNDPA